LWGGARPTASRCAAPPPNTSSASRTGVSLRIGEQGRTDAIRSPWENAKITGADYSESLGNWLALETATGDRYQLGHLHESAADRVGQTIERGGYLATEGNSGKSSGYHLDLRLLEQTEDDRHVNTDSDEFCRHLTASFGATAERASDPQEMRVVVEHRGLDKI
jgi:murein DD-endopeptidase MepM/ murein hydrolase activator NlpD